MTKGEFDFALDWTKRNYPDLWLNGAHFTIEYLPAKGYKQNTLGLCYRAENGISPITIRRSSLHVSHVIDTIVHELTHAKQNLENSPKTLIEREDEAYKAGIEARYKYMKGTRCNQ